MKKIAIFAPESPGKMAGENTPPQLGIRLVDEPLSPTPAPADPAPSGATAHEVGSGDALSPDKPLSVVSKVTKLLIRQGRDMHCEHPIRPEDGFVPQKILMSLHAKQPL